MRREKFNTSRERTEAWKYVGYPGFSRFMASSSDCLALRKFSYLNVRVLLKLQNELAEMERKLDDMDDFSMSLPDGEGGCGSLKLDENTPREMLLQEIAATLKDYNLHLTDFLRLENQSAASLEQVRNVQNWLKNYPNAIEGSEQEFIRFENDLLSTRIARRTHFGRWMESIRVSQIVSFRGSNPNSAAKYYDRNAWKSIGNFWLLFAMILMLLGPLWSLPFAIGSAVRLAVVTAFTTAFSLLVIVGTTLKASQRGILVAGYFTQLILVLGMGPSWPRGDVYAVNTPTASPVSTITSTATYIPVSASTVATTITQAITTIVISTPTMSFTQTTSMITAPTTPLPVTDSAPGLSTGAKAGIGVGIGLAVLLVLLLTTFILVRRSKHKDPGLPPYNHSELPEVTERRIEDGNISPFVYDNERIKNRKASATSPFPSTSKGKGRSEYADQADLAAGPSKGKGRQIEIKLGESTYLAASEPEILSSVAGEGKSGRAHPPNVRYTETPLSAVTTLCASSTLPSSTPASHLWATKDVQPRDPSH